MIDYEHHEPEVDTRDVIVAWSMFIAVLATVLIVAA